MADEGGLTYFLPQESGGGADLAEDHDLYVQLALAQALFAPWCTWQLLRGSLMEGKEKLKRSQRWGPQSGEDPLGNP